MTLPPEMPAYRRVPIIIGRLLVLVAAAAIAGVAPVLKRWFGEWQAGAAK